MEMSPKRAAEHVVLGYEFARLVRPSVWVRVWGWFRRLK